MDRIRAMTVGEAYEGGLRIEGAHWRQIAAIHVGWAAPMSVLHLLAALVLGQDFDAALKTLETEQRFDPGILPFLGGMFLVGVVQSFGALLLRLGLARFFASELLGRPSLTVAQLGAWLRRQLGPAFGVAVRLELILVAATLLAFLAVGMGAGLVTLAAASGSGSLLVLGVGLGAALSGVVAFLAIRWAVRACLAPIVFAVEEGEPVDAVARSRALLQTGGTGRVFGALLLSALASVALAQGTSALFPDDDRALVSAAETCAFLFAWLPFEAYFSRVLTLLYFDRRVRFEAFGDQGPQGVETGPDSPASA